MAKHVIIPPSKNVKARPAQRPPVPSDMVLNCTQFVNTLKGTHLEIYSTLVKLNRATFHGTLDQWAAELDTLKDAPAR